MACRCTLSSSLLLRLSSLRVVSSNVVTRSSIAIRCFSDDKKGGNKDDDNGDPFGVHYQDGDDRVGPKEELPPRYVRDVATGKFTGKIEQDLLEEQERMLKMDEKERHGMITERLVKKWNKALDEMGDSQHQADVARRIREEDMALNTLGRSGDAQNTKGKTEDSEDDACEDETGFSKPLSPNEFKSFQRFMKKEHKVEVDQDDIPVQQTRDVTQNFTNADNPDLDLQWLTVTAQRVMSDQPDDPFTDLMPSDLNPARKANRRRAKKIPKKLLHHNNLAFLRRYVTPSGQIMNRVQSRLGAKEQRKVAKLIKRARHLGLIPFMGQWKFTNHGNIYEKGIDEDKEWEKELKRRGLVIRERETSDKK